MNEQPAEADAQQDAGEEVAACLLAKSRFVGFEILQKSY
jgi:hypothetical protein